MKKEYLSPLLNMVAMLLLVTSRWLSEKRLNWLAIIALIIFSLSAFSLYKAVRKSK
ncbi:MAG: hypothetical protein KDC78_10255 [Aequorivita sp.]|nr:hypothetical protein [Aequorivita sp.]